MTVKKGWGSTVAGWFIEREEDAGQTPDADMSAADTEAIINAASGASPNEAYASPSSTQNVFQTAPPPATGGQVDFEAVFDAAGVDTEERARVARTVELLKSLPAGTDAGVKKQIVEASLKAFGVPIEKIIEAGVEEIQALDGYIRNGASDNEKLMAESDARIKQYEEEIRNIRGIMQQSVSELQNVIKVCNDKKLEVQQVLEFFGQAKVAEVVRESPKLHDPSAAPDTTAS
ncbi:MAG: hypothetical protein H7Z38_12870 [Rubrivivax sp.]|nr:hypothetical protein [Pyrinomonadaceae bacterium]